MTVPRLLGSMTAAAPSAAASELLVLLPSLGTTTALWDGVVADLSSAPDAPRILRIDLPGHGASPAAREPFTIAELATGVLRLVDEIGGGAFHVAGDSLGGVIALELAAVHAERVRSLSMFASNARIGTAEGWADRAAQTRASGTASLVAGSAARWFAPDYLMRTPDGPGSRALEALLDIDDESYALCADALGTFDRRDALASLAVPALVVAGAHDAVTTSDAMRELAAAIPAARFVELLTAAHLPPLENPDEVAGLLREMLRAASGDPAAASVADLGMATRRAVLGDAHVDAATAAITPETAPFQEFITRYAWGEVWSRPQLDRRQRSVATLASLVTGGHPAELRMHVRAALRNGLSREEIAETILHTALYAGLPAANEGLAIMREVFAETTTEDPRG